MLKRVASIMTEHTLSYCSCAHFTDTSLPRLRMGCLYLDKLHAVHPVGAQLGTSARITAPAMPPCTCKRWGLCKRCHQRMFW